MAYYTYNPLKGYVCKVEDQTGTFVSIHKSKKEALEKAIKECNLYILQHSLKLEQYKKSLDIFEKMKTSKKRSLL